MIRSRRVDDRPDPVVDAEPAFAERLVAEAVTRQVMHFNPDAALQKRIFDDGFVPNSEEFAVEREGMRFQAQQAEHLRSGERRVYYVAHGDWDNVRFVRSGTA